MGALENCAHAARANDPLTWLARLRDPRTPSDLSLPLSSIQMHFADAPAVRVLIRDSVKIYILYSIVIQFASQGENIVILALLY